MMKILVTARSFRQTPGRHKELLEQSGHQVVESTFDRPLKELEMVGLIADVDGVILGMDDVTARVIEAARQLKVLSRYGVGMDKVDVHAATDAGVVVTNTPGTNHIAVAELALGLMLSLLRRIPQHDSSTKEGSWARERGAELAGKTVGIVGLGAVGREVAKRLRGFDVRLLVYDPYVSSDVVEAQGAQRVDLETLLREGDVVTLHAPVTEETRGMLGQQEFGLMKPSACLVNTARAELTDEDALYEVLKSGGIGGAGLDAFSQEPPPPQCPLLQLPNVVATPHIGATTCESILRMGTLAVENALQVLRGERPDHVVNPEVYERPR
jgi:D-3-phosphoglycerate dehydrogenase